MAETIDLTLTTFALPSDPTDTEPAKVSGTYYIDENLTTFQVAPDARSEGNLFNVPIIFHSLTSEVPIIFHSLTSAKPIIFHSTEPRRTKVIEKSLLTFSVPSAPTEATATNSSTAETIDESKTTFALPSAPVDTVEVGSSQYPTQDADHVKATSTRTGDYYPYNATNPAESLTGAMSGSAWCADSHQQQRFHIDLGSAKVVQGIYYENSHDSGSETDMGANNFTFLGSNEESAFLDLTYTHDDDWTAITSVPTAFEEHTGSDTEDPKLINLTNSTAYQYYAVKIVDNHGDGSYMGLRRIELRTFA